jgi:hypothetical protein
MVELSTKRGGPYTPPLFLKKGGSEHPISGGVITPLTRHPDFKKAVEINT